MVDRRCVHVSVVSVWCIRRSCVMKLWCFRRRKSMTGLWYAVLALLDSSRVHVSVVCP